MRPSSDELAKRFPGVVALAHRADLAPLVTRLEPVTFEAGELYAREGGAAPGLGLVVSGGFEVEVATPRGGSEVLGEVGPGGVLGEVSFLDGGPSSATLRATTETNVWRLDTAGFEALASAHPRLAVALLHAMSETLAARIRRAIARIEAAPPESVRALFGVGGAS